MGNTAIRPALTPEEWAEVAKENIDVTDYLSAYEAGSPEIIYGHERAVAALALYGQPFGFTHADVTLLRAAADACRNDDHYIARFLGDEDDSVARESRLAARYETLADRIEALLPPESHA